MDDNYILIHCYGGDFPIKEYTGDELLDFLNEEGIELENDFLRSISDIEHGDLCYFEGKILIKGRVIQPVEKIKVKEFDLPE